MFRGEKKSQTLSRLEHIRIIDTKINRKPSRQVQPQNMAIRTQIAHNFNQVIEINTSQQAVCLFVACGIAC